MTRDRILQKIQDAEENQLEELDISNDFFTDDENKLTEIPEEVFKLINLKVLKLNYNKISHLPESLGNLTNLNELYLSGNQLTSLPEFLGNLTNLNELYLSENQLTSLPESLGNLTNLNKLNLSGNQLTSLPESLGNLTNLNNLSLGGNRLKQPPLEIATKGVQSIKEYFEQLSTEEKDYIYEAKLLIVGEGGAGKTTLAKKIQNPEYKLRESEPLTEGIDVIKWSFTLPDKEREFKVNIWDFGGQEIYHATHQFFLTKRSLYILVADTRKEDTDFYYWLNIVELLSDNSPLLIIKNEKEDRQKEINETALRGRFTNLKETLATNLKTNRGLRDVITNIQDYIKKLPHIGQTLPKTWVKVRQALENDTRNYISLQEYFDICQANGFTRLEDKLQLSGYLHDLGVCIHFQDEEDSLLYRTVILKPEWGTDAVYKVLNNKEVINNKGHFTRKDLKNIWQDEKYASMRGELLELMKKFQLCYEVPESKDTLIAPQLLSDNQPEYDWDESHNLILRYAYLDFMPKGIITHFIVIMHQYIEQQEYVWKTGVILNKDNTRAEVIENYGKREIKIRIFGSYKRELLNMITYELNKIHHSYKRLKYSKLIPCNCSTCKDSQSPHFYDFDMLRNFIADKQYKIQCQKSYQMVNALGLIDDILDLKKSIYQEKQDINKSINFEGDVQQLILQLPEKGNYFKDRNIKIQGDYYTSNYNENIAGGYITENSSSIQNIKLARRKEIFEINYQDNLNLAKNKIDVDDLCQKASICEQKHQLNEAIRYYKQAINVDRHYLGAWHGLARIYKSLGEKEKQSSTLDKIELIVNIDRKKLDIDELYRKARLHERQTEFHEAIRYYEKLLNIEKYYLKAWEGLEIIYRYLGEDDKQVKALQQVQLIKDIIDFETNAEQKITLQQLEFLNLDFFGNSQWTFQPQINILLGKNGYGKSYLLRLIISLLQRDDNISSQFFGDRLENAFMQLSLERNKTEQVIERSKTVFKKSIGKVPILAIPDLRYIDKSKSTISLFDDEKSDMREYGAYHFLYEQSFEGLIQNFLYELCIMFINQDRSAQDRSFDLPIFQLLHKVVKELTDEAFEFSEIKPRGNARFEINVITDGNNDRLLPLQKASQGTLSVLSIFGLIYYYLKSVFPDTPEKDLLSKPAIVFIDEVDAHLHPSWQQKIIRLLRENFPNVQFVLTAHSPLVVAGCFNSEVSVLRKVSGKQVIIFALYLLILSELYRLGSLIIHNYLRKVEDGFVIQEFSEDFIGETTENLYRKLFEIEDIDENYLYYATRISANMDNSERINMLESKEILTNQEEIELEILHRDDDHIISVAQKIEEKEAQDYELIIEELKAEIRELKYQLELQQSNKNN